MKQRFDTVFTGAIWGTLAPVFGTLIYFLLQRYVFHKIHVNLDQFLAYVGKGKALPALISLSLVANLLVFFLCLRTNMHNAARGAILATIGYGILMIIIKFV